MTGKTAEKTGTTAREEASRAVDPRERALIVHTLAHTIYQHIAQQHAHAYGWGHVPPTFGFHPYGQFAPPPRVTGMPGSWFGAPTPWNQDVPMAPPHVPGKWGG